jgi:hypothetical protein
MDHKKIKSNPTGAHSGFRGVRAPQPNPKRNFEQLQASLLHCPKCKKAVQVRERLLLVLPDGQLFEYRCVSCGSSIGERTEKNAKPVKIIL